MFANKYTFVLYFGDFIENINCLKMKELFDCWGRMENVFKVEPKIYPVSDTFYITKYVPKIAPIPINNKLEFTNNFSAIVNDNTTMKSSHPLAKAGYNVETFELDAFDEDFDDF